MARSNKVIVFIVEGSTDRYSRTSNIDSKIGSFIKKAIERDKFNIKDIEKVVHLVDTDGAYILDENIVFKDIEDPFYTPNTIETNNVDYMKKRNQQKRNILNKLSTMSTTFKGKPYRVYYMSCNLEHVLHNIQNAPKDEKKKLAEALEERFYDNPDAFVEYMHDTSFVASGTYEDTWKYIKNGVNSLNRYSNFHLFLE